MTLPTATTSAGTFEHDPMNGWQRTADGASCAPPPQRIDAERRRVTLASRGKPAAPSALVWSPEYNAMVSPEQAERARTPSPAPADLEAVIAEQREGMVLDAELAELEAQR